MKKLVVLLFVLALVFAFAGCGSSNISSDTSGDSPSDVSSGGDVIHLKFAHAGKLEHPTGESARYFAERVAEESGGTLIIDVYPNRELGEEVQVFEMVQQGSVDMTIISVSTMYSANPYVSALQAPFMFVSWDHYLEAMCSDDSVVSDFLTVCEDTTNTHGLGVWQTAWRNLYTTKPINTLEDMKGLICRCPESKYYAQFLESLGINPVSLAYGECYTALQNGVIDSISNDYSSVFYEKFYEVADYGLEAKYFTWPNVCSINLDTWNKLSPEHQKILTEVSNETARYIISYIQDVVETDQRQLMMDAGVTFSTPSDELLDQMVELSSFLVDEYKSLDPRCEALIDHCWALREKYL